MFKNILVPVYGFEESQAALNWVATLSRLLRAEITILSVVDPEEADIASEIMGDLPHYTHQYGTKNAFLENIIKKVQSRLETMAETLRTTGIETTASVGYGKPATTIIEIANKIEADLIVMSANRDSIQNQGFLGSVTNGVLHSSNIPLLILQNKLPLSEIPEDGLIKQVVVPIDGSSLSEKAVGPGIDIATATGANLVFAKTVRLPVYAMEWDEFDQNSTNSSSSVDTHIQEENATEYLNQFVERADNLELNANASVQVGNPSNHLVKKASEIDESIIVMATHGAGSTNRWITGSVTDRTIRSTRQPILVIPARQAA